jgi:carbon-monoxide dehydrogenase medium subunit
MFLRAISYAAPTSIDEAVALLAEHGADARMLAGGTDLIVQVREDGRDASVFVDAKQIDELMELSVSAGSGATLGAAVPCYEVYGNEAFAAQYPAVVDAARIIGSTGIQGRASIGGNVCNSGPAADSIPPLIVYSATCNIAGPRGIRTIAIEDFCTAPGRNVLADDELLVSLTLPPQPDGSGAHYLRFIPRNEMDIAVVGCGVSLVLDGDTISAARLALAAVAPTPLFVESAGAALVGQPATEESFEAAAEAAREAAKPIDDMRGTIAHRKQLSYVLAKRALAGALARAKGMEIDHGH